MLSPAMGEMKLPGDWVNDGEADCAEGEDEAEGAEDDIVTCRGEHEEFLDVRRG